MVVLDKEADKVTKEGEEGCDVDGGDRSGCQGAPPGDQGSPKLFKPSVAFIQLFFSLSLGSRKRSKVLKISFGKYSSVW